MSPEQFAYWLQGYSEIFGENPTPEQWRMIQEHLNLVFRKETSTPEGRIVVKVNDPGFMKLRTCLTC